MLSGEVSHVRTKGIKTPLNIVQGQERVWVKRHFISEPYLHEEMALPIYKITEDWIVNQEQPLGSISEQEPKQTQTIYVDGCKVTIRYAGEKNPAAVREIKDILLSSIAKKP